MMVQGAQSPQFAMSTEAHPAPGANGTTGALPQGPQGASSSNVAMQSPMQVPASTLGKRKAETQENERLSKRLSLLNLGMYLFFLIFFFLIHFVCFNPILKYTR